VGGTLKALSRSYVLNVHSILDKFRTGFDVKMLHHGVFVESNRSGRDVQDKRRLLHRTTFGQQLEHLFLPQCQMFGAFKVLEVLQRRTKQVFRHERRDVRATARD
jgi:hypothetical protein